MTKKLLSLPVIWALWCSAAHAQENAPLEPQEIEYKLIGKAGGETIVLIHGLDSAHQTFESITEALAERHQVLLYDQRGHGKTVARGEEYSSEVLARDLQGLLRHLGLKQVWVLGHSMGARTAVRFAELYPHRVRGVIVEDMEMQRRTQPSDEVKEVARKIQKAFEGRTFASRAELKDALTPLYGEEAESLTFRRARENADGSMTLLFRPWVSLLYGHQGNTEDLTGALKRLRVPVLFVRADPRRGSAMSQPGVEHVRKVVPAARVVMVEGSGHTIHRTHAEEFVGLVNEFVSAPRRSWLAREAGGAGTFAAAYFLKESVPALLTGRPERIVDTGREMKRPVFWLSLGAFSGASQATDAGVRLTRLPGRAVWRTFLPLTAGMAAAQVVSGRAPGRELAVSAATFLAVGGGIELATMGLVPQGRVLQAAWRVAKLAVTLAVAERIERPAMRGIDELLRRF